MEGTDVCATTLHSLFDLSGNDFTSKLDFAKGGEKVNQLVKMQCLLLDECSMIDAPFFEAFAKLLSTADHNRRGNSRDATDPFGWVHLLLYGDFKQ